MPTPFTSNVNAVKLPELIDDKVLRYEREYGLTSDAARLIARQISAGKIDPDSIDKNLIKDNIYSSLNISG